MVGEHQPVPLAPTAGSARTAAAAATRQVEPLGALLRQQLGRAAARAPLRQAPTDRSRATAAATSRHDHLHRAARAARAGSTPAGWRADRAAPAPPPPAPRSSSAPSQLQIELHRVDVRLPAHRRAHGTAGPPAAATAAACPRAADAACSSRSISPCVSAHQRQVARAAAAGAGLRGVRAPARSSAANQLSRQVAHRRLRQQRRRPRPVRLQPRPVGALERERIDLERVRQRHRADRRRRASTASGAALQSAASAGAERGPDS